MFTKKAKKKSPIPASYKLKRKTLIAYYRDDNPVVRPMFDLIRRKKIQSESEAKRSYDKKNPDMSRSQNLILQNPIRIRIVVIPTQTKKALTKWLY